MIRLLVFMSPKPLNPHFMFFDFCANGRSASLRVEKSERLTVEGLGSIQPRGSVSGFSVILKPLGSKDSKNKVLGSSAEPVFFFFAVRSLLLLGRLKTSQGDG